MSDILAQYKALDVTTTSTRVTQTLQAIIGAPPYALSDSARRDLLQILLDDIRATYEHRLHRLHTSNLPTALLAVKTLGRIVQGSAVIVSDTNFRLLLTIASDTSPSNSDSSKEALRCVANALLLIDSARASWLAIGGGELCISILENPNASPDYTFLASRILFLSTMTRSPFLRNAIENLHVVDSICSKLDALLPLSAPMSKEAMVDLLKVVFNLQLQYPRMVAEEKGSDSSATETGMGEVWDEKFEPLITPLLRVFTSLPPTTPPLIPPLTHVIHSLLNVPIEPYRTIWFPPTPRSSSEHTHQNHPHRTNHTRSMTSETFHKALSLLSISSNPRSSPSSPPSRSSSNSSSPPGSPSSSHPPPFDVLKRLYQLLDSGLNYYTPTDPDHPSVRQLCTKEGVQLDDILCPVVLLIVRLVKGDETARRRTREWLLPADLDRTTPLEKREDLLGRSIRLLASVYFPRLKDSTGEMFFTLCDSDPSTMSAQIGYGNAAGYLFNRGILSVPGSNPSSSPFSPGINPITGTTMSAEQVEPEMTEEEKEREAERLFVLFDRLERSGMAVNPVRKAMQEGRLEEVRDEPAESD